VPGILELLVGGLACRAGVAERLDSPTELVEVDDDRDARRGAARRRLSRRRLDDACRRDHEGRGGQTCDVTEHGSAAVPEQQ
jgi:hypothetical protein